MSEPIRVLVVDDQEPLRRSIGTILAVDPRIEVRRLAADGREAVELVRSHRIDVVCMDIRMPGLDGIGATERIVAVAPETRVLMLTTFDDGDLVEAAIRAGASGYLTKDTRPTELRQAVIDVASGAVALTPSVAATVIGMARRAPVPQPQAISALTAREAEVFGLIALGRSNAEIADELFLSANTVKTHIRAILGKLRLRDRVHLVLHAHEHGLVPRSRPD